MEDQERLIERFDRIILSADERRFSQMGGGERFDRMMVDRMMGKGEKRESVWVNECVGA